MAGVRDPAFWKRFSVAVHMDEEQAPSRQQQLKAGEYSWLERQQRKRSRRTMVCCCFWGFFGAFIAGLVIVVVWYLHVTNSSPGSGV